MAEATRTHETVGSWIVVSRMTGAAVWEIFSAKMAAAVRQDRYEVLPVGEYLGRLNRRIAAGLI